MIFSLFYVCRVIRILYRLDCVWVFEKLRLPSYLRFIIGFVGFFVIKEGVRGRSDGERLCFALREMGPSYIKLGQAVSVRPDIFGRELTESLRGLQDRLDSFPFAEVEKIIKNNFGVSWRELFLELSEEPAGAASVAQVHKGVTVGGREVAVKVLRPGIVEKFNRDIEFFRYLSKFLESVNSRCKTIGLLRLVDEFAVWVSNELDLVKEAACATELRMNFKGYDNFYVPDVDWKLTCSSVMTSSWIEGIRIDDKEGRSRLGLDDDILLERCAEIFFLQVFRDGFFHADLHPGNVFVDGAGRICPVDFGIMGKIDDDRKRYLGFMLSCFMNRDYDGLVKVHSMAGMLPEGVNMQAFKQALISVGEPAFELDIVDISIARLLGRMFDVFKKFKITPKPELLLLEKTMLMAEGLGYELNPNVNIWTTIVPLMENWILKEGGVGKKIEKLSVKLSDLGQMIDRGSLLLRQIENNTLKGQTESKKSVESKKSNDIAFEYALTLFLFGLLVGVGLTYLLV